jgi:hypothetical protein
VENPVPQLKQKRSIFQQPLFFIKMKEFFYLLVACLILVSCNKDAELITTDYPLVLTDNISVTEDGATFSAEIIDIGTEEILEYGFVWSKKSIPTITNFHKTVKGNPGKGTYHIEVNYGLQKDQQYNLRAYILTNKSVVYGTEKSFVSMGSNPPMITDFNPKYGSIGTAVVIEGKNFSESVTGDSVKFGEAIAVIDSVFEDRLYTHVPEIKRSELATLYLTSAGMTTASIQQFDIWFPWSKIKDRNILGYNSTDFVLYDKVYFLGLYNANMIIYQPETDLWGKEIPLPDYSFEYGSIYFAFRLQNIGYFFLNNTLWSFDPQREEWSKKANFPGNLQRDERYRFGMCINGKFYLGNCYQGNELWEYNPENDSWCRKANFTNKFNTSTPVWGSFAFSINGKGYLGINQAVYLNTFWEYDPINDSWSEKTAYPGKGYMNIGCFVIKDECFVGLGYSEEWGDGYVARDIWKYDPTYDSWTPYHNCPEAMSVNDNFVFEDKGYVFPETYRFDSKTNEIWVFDPSKN